VSRDKSKGILALKAKAERQAGLITYEIGGESLFIEEVLGRHTYSEER